MQLTGLPQGQEKSGNQKKSGKTKKNDKSQEKMGVFEVFEKMSGNLTKFKKKLDIGRSNLQNSLFSKAFKW